MPEKSAYNVVFRYTKEAGGYEGVMYWTSYKDEEEFHRFYTDDLKKLHEIVEEGVSQERAIELSNNTPLHCRVKAYIQDATLPDGEIDDDVLEMHLSSYFLTKSLCS